MIKTKGKILWTDLTVKDADLLSNFYESVIGWKRKAVTVGDHEDYTMETEDGTIISGVCHNSGSLSDFPNQWLNYFSVNNIEESIKNCTDAGGSLIVSPTVMGGVTIAVLKDPQGAFFGITDG